MTNAIDRFVLFLLKHRGNAGPLLQYVFCLVAMRY